ncbi:hypothetical protein HH310_40230 [Actinoplanes sp. TBRC 11911]|uniref:YciI family protein n=1 Tax=Actinoplanes sp. TBRC 11911 TaxID=2729386 RepID=UPI00145CA1B4|nr:YciI family protein [Actinoplanes sp. TBRC 11911]NMO57388.1 hypothetical protein [Actinoplanes sp. TBRC 11911]
MPEPRAVPGGRLDRRAFFVYGRDHPGSFELKMSLNEEHWSFMDRYGDRLIARGPTVTEDGESSTGSLHIVALASVTEAREFAFDEPYFRAGVFESVLLCGFVDQLGRTMWEFQDAVPGLDRFLVISPGAATSPKHLIAYGDLLSLDTSAPLGRAAVLEASSPDDAARALPAPDGARVEVHHWRFGGRPGVASLRD